MRIATDWDGDKLLFRSDWVMLTQSRAFVAEVPSDPPDDIRPSAPVLWTDHYSNLFALLK